MPGYHCSLPKNLAAIATSVVQSFPDGLNKNQIQYAPQHSPLVWLPKFDISKSEKYLIHNFHSQSLQAMLGVPETELSIILGFFYEHVKKEIAIVKKELSNDDHDFIDDQITAEERKKNKVCCNGHININPRAQRKYCSNKGCKHLLLIFFPCYQCGNYTDRYK